mmetsp:Transcript_40434/g.90892  ORF Transcript_40434/g.90892 Transcript_40434/m.90892 type:complete len:375 (-) Transcript_40434:749-1873(-)
MPLPQELLHVLRRRPPGPGVVHPAPRHQRHDRQHLRARPQLQDRKKVGVIVPQHIPRHGDRVLPRLRPLQGKARGRGRGEELEVQPSGVVVDEVLVHLPAEDLVVGEGGVQPEHGRSAGGLGSGHGELHPVLQGGLLGGAGPPDVPGLHLVLHHRTPGSHDPNYTCARGLERLIRGPVLLRAQGHQPDVGHGPHGGRIKRSVGLAEFDGLLVDVGVGAVREHGLGVAELGVISPRGGVRGPHASSQPVHTSDHPRHRSIHNHVTGAVQVGHPLAGIHHSQLGVLRVAFLDLGLQLLPRLLVQSLHSALDVPEPIVGIHPELVKKVLILLEQILEKDLHAVAENGSIAHLHQSRLEVQGKKHILLFGVLNLFLKK